jgi:hypothetical protein
MRYFVQENICETDTPLWVDAENEHNGKMEKVSFPPYNKFVMGMFVTAIDLETALEINKHRVIARKDWYNFGKVREWVIYAPKVKEKEET